MKLNLSRKILILVAVPLAFELIFVMCLRGLLYQVEQEKAREIHARDVAARVNTVLRLTLDITVSTVLGELQKLRGFATPDAQEHLRMVAQLDAENALLRDLVHNHPEEAKLARLDALYLPFRESLRSAKAQFENGQTVVALKSWTRMQALQRQIFRGFEDIIAEQQAEQQARIVAQQKAKELLYALLLYGAALNVVLAIFLVYLFNRSTTRRLNILVDNTIRLAHGQMLNPSLEGEDELAKLDQTFREMAAALAVANRKERAIVDKAIDVICSTDANYRLQRVSPASERLWRLAPSELVGTDLLQIIAQEDRQVTAKTLKGIKDGGGDASFENRVIRKDGTHIDMLWSARWSEEDKTLFCIAHDITERKQAENALKQAEAWVRSVVESLPIGLAIIDPTGCIQFANPSMNKMFAMDSSELVGKSIASLFATNQVSDKGEGDSGGESGRAGDTQKTFVDELLSNAKNHDWELRGIKSGGQPFPAEVGITDFQAGSADNYLAVIADVTERHEVDRLRHEFMAMVSHDLRAPLTSIQGFLDLLDTDICGELNAKGKKKLKAAEGAMDSLLSLVRDLLDIERSRAGMLTLHKQKFSMAKLIERAIESVRVSADNLDITIEAELCGSEIDVDGDRIVQTVTNFLSNALKFSPAGSTIYVSEQTKDEWVEVRVRDLGVGIPTEFQERIFDRFQQVRASDATVAGGSGLGLAICKAIVEQHGGCVGVDSVEGQGSTFWFVIPVSKSPL